MAGFCVWTHPTGCRRAHWGIVTNIVGRNINRLKKGEFWKKKKIKSEKGVFFFILEKKGDGSEWSFRDRQGRLSLPS